MKHRDVKIIASASYFAFVSRQVRDIATAFSVDTRTIRRYAQTELWEKTLDVVGYQGQRTFEHQPTRDIQRDTDGVYDAAKAAYQDALERGEPTHKLAHIAAESVGVSTRKVRDWAQKYKWKKGD